MKPKSVNIGVYHLGAFHAVYPQVLRAHSWRQIPSSFAEERHLLTFTNWAR